MEKFYPLGTRYHKKSRKCDIKKAFAVLLVVGAFELGIQFVALPFDFLKPGQQDSAPPGRTCDEKLDALDAVFNKRRNARPANGTPDYGKTFFDMFEPEAVCLSEERFGAALEKNRYEVWGDGPKFVCGIDYLNVSKSCLVYSVGSSNDIQFEASVKKYLKDCEIHTFDPTVKYADFKGHHVAEYHEWGLGEDGKFVNFGVMNTTLKSLETVMRDLGHLNRPIDIFKIDCEQCEWELFPLIFDAIAEGKLSINQIQVEMHNHYWKGGVNDIYGFFSKADKAGFRIFHKERNHWGCKGQFCVEYSLVSDSWLREVHKYMIC